MKVKNKSLILSSFVLGAFILFLLLQVFSCSKETPTYHITYKIEDKYIELFITDQNDKTITIDNNFTFYDGNTVIPIFEGNRIYPCSNIVYHLVAKMKNNNKANFLYGSESSQQSLQIEFELNSDPNPKYCTEPPEHFKFDSIISIKPCKIKIYSNYSNSKYSVTGKYGDYSKEPIWDITNIDTYNIYALVDENGDGFLDTLAYPSNSIPIKKIGCSECNRVKQAEIINKFNIYADKYIKNPVNSDTEMQKKFFMMLSDNAIVIINGKEYTDMALVLNELVTSFKNKIYYKLILEKTLINDDCFVSKVIFLKTKNK